VQLPELVEGLQYEYSLLLENQTGQDWREVRNHTGCKCLSVKEAAPREVKDSEEFQMSILVLPTSDNFSQELKFQAYLSGAKDEQLVAKLLIAAKTTPPVICSHQTVVFGDQDRRKIKLITSDKRFRIKESAIQLSTPDFGCRAERFNDEISVSLEEGDEQLKATEYRYSVVLNVPLQFEHSEEIRWFQQKLVLAKQGDVVVSPSSVSFRRSKGRYTAGIMIHDRLGNPRGHIPQYQCYVERQGEKIADIAIDVAETRPVAGNRMYVRLELSESSDDYKDLTLVIRFEDQILKRVPMTVME
jgi:hypothetical protein